MEWIDTAYRAEAAPDLKQHARYYEAICEFFYIFFFFSICWKALLFLAG